MYSHVVIFLEHKKIEEQTEEKSRKTVDLVIIFSLSLSLFLLIILPRLVA